MIDAEMAEKLGFASSDEPMVRVQSALDISRSARVGVKWHHEDEAVALRAAIARLPEKDAARLYLKYVPRPVAGPKRVAA